ncbi:uncharacterized protein LOC114544405 isoform X1 [Dendronephthya gigantea]|uniref:uncharacterized protein LOC114544405 isoform X1 n=2 Tax=Dendronephthya gigantea TaxID=151771 RepID=UPI001069829A|nr:uncharacterized protein LOC114544405 isoform X1 [Dendronephthya gigantea]
MSGRDALFHYATTIDRHLLKMDRLLEATKRLLDLSSYFDVNEHPFKMSLSFVATRILRSSKDDEKYGESNLGLIFSEERNCGKTLTLRLIAKFQGIAQSRHPLLLSGGNQNTSGTSGKMALESLSKSSLVSLLDDSIINQNLGEFLNQVQGGLAQGSSKSGLLYPKGSLLLSSNKKEVQRILGRVVRFDYRLNPNHEDHNEAALTKFACGNKGILVAWCMRFLPIYEEIIESYFEDVKCILKAHFNTGCQMRWIKGVAYNLITYTMIHASAQKHPDLTNAITMVIQGNMSRSAEKSTIQRLMVDIYSLILQSKSKDVSCLTWINPLPKVQITENGSWEKAICIKTVMIGEMQNVSWTEVKQEIQSSTVNGWEQRSICFAKGSNANLADVRSKRNSTLVTTGQGFKIPQKLLDPLFIEWVNFVTGNNGQLQPDVDFIEALTNKEEHGDDMERNLEKDEADTVRSIEQEIVEKVSDYCDRIRQGYHNTNDDVPSSPSNAQDYSQFLSPESKKLYNRFTPKRLKAFDMAVKAVERASRLLSEEPTAHDRTIDTAIDTASGSGINQTPIPSNSEVNPKRKLLFAQGAFGVMNDSTEENKKIQRREDCPCGDDEEIVGENWVQCDNCGQWYHLKCTNLEKIPPKRQKWFCSEKCTEQIKGKRSKQRK